MKKNKIDERRLNALEAFCNSVLRKHGKYIASTWLIKSPRVVKNELYIVILVNDLKAGKTIIKRIKNDIIEIEKAVLKNMEIRIHSGFYMLSKYFERVMKNDQEIFMEIRHSMPVYDPAGFFGPLKKLVISGNIEGTEESLLKLVFDIKERFRDINRIKIKIIDKVYSAVVSSGQAALMSSGVSFPTHTNVAMQLERRFVKRGLLEKRYAEYCREIVNFVKDMEHKKIKNINGKQIDNFMKKGNLFVERMKELVEEIGRLK